jgi:hypothetical protein
LTETVSSVNIVCYLMKSSRHFMEEWLPSLIDLLTATRYQTIVLRPHPIFGSYFSQTWMKYNLRIPKKPTKQMSAR